MDTAQGKMTVDRLIARLVDLEREYTRLQREYARVGAELVALQMRQPRIATQVPAGPPLVPPDEGYEDARFSGN